MTSSQQEAAPVAHLTAQHQRKVMGAAYAIVINGGLNAGLGVAYWVLAAHLYPPATVGRNAALVAALLTIASIAQLNYARSLSGLLPRSGRGASLLLRRIYLLTGSVGAILGAAFLMLAPHLSEAFDFVQDRWWVVGGFAAAVAVWCVFSLQDTALVSLRYAHVLPIENAFYGLAKIAGLWGLHAAGAGTWAIFASFMAPLVLCIVPVNFFLFSRALHTLPSTTEPVQVAPGWVGYDFAGYLISRLSTRPLPVLVLAVNGAEAAAAAYVALTMATSLDLLTLGIGNTLTAELARGETPLSALRRMVVRTCLLIGSLSAALAIGAPVVLRFFGKSYAAGGSVLLVLLMISAVPRSVIFFAIASARARRDGRKIFALHAVPSVLSIALGGALLLVFGVPGLGIGWLTAYVAVGVAALGVLRHILEARPRTEGAQE